MDKFVCVPARTQADLGIFSWTGRYVFNKDAGNYLTARRIIKGWGVKLEKGGASIV